MATTHHDIPASDLLDELTRRGYVEIARRTDTPLGSVVTFRKEKVIVQLYEKVNQDGIRVLVGREGTRSAPEPTSYVAFARGDSPTSWWEAKLANRGTHADQVQELISNFDVVEGICYSAERFFALEEYVAQQLSAPSRIRAAREQGKN